MRYNNVQLHEANKFPEDITENRVHNSKSESKMINS
jgi:hypothetical protein